MAAPDIDKIIKPFEDLATQKPNDEQKAKQDKAIKDAGGKFTPIMEAREGKRKALDKVGKNAADMEALMIDYRDGKSEDLLRVLQQTEATGQVQQAKKEAFAHKDDKGNTMVQVVGYNKLTEQGLSADATMAVRSQFFTTNNAGQTYFETADNKEDFDAAIKFAKGDVKAWNAEDAAGKNMIGRLDTSEVESAVYKANELVKAGVNPNAKAKNGKTNGEIFKDNVTTQMTADGKTPAEIKTQMDDLDAAFKAPGAPGGKKPFFKKAGLDDQIEEAAKLAKGEVSGGQEAAMPKGKVSTQGDAAALAAAAAAAKGGLV